MTVSRDVLKSIGNSALSVMTSAVTIYVANKYKEEMVRLVRNGLFVQSDKTPSHRSHLLGSKKITHIDGIADVADPEVIGLLGAGLIEDLTESVRENPSPKVIFNAAFVDEVVSVLNRGYNDRVLISGGTGSGKTTFIQYLTSQILSGASSLKGRRVFLVKKNDVRILEILSERMTETCLIVIDEAHSYILPENLLTRIKMNPENCALSVKLKEQSNYLRTSHKALPPILAATDQPKDIADDPALKRRFGLIRAIPSRSSEDLLKQWETSIPNFVFHWILPKYPHIKKFQVEEGDVPKLLVYLVPLHSTCRSSPTNIENFLAKIFEREAVKALRDGKTEVTLTEEKIYDLLCEESKQTKSSLISSFRKAKDSASGFSPPVQVLGCMRDMTLDEGLVPESIGREEEMKALVKHLSKGENNSVILKGKAGIGKTTLVRSLANLLYRCRSDEAMSALSSLEQDIQAHLKEMRIFELTLNKFFVEVEGYKPLDRLNRLLDEVERSGSNIVLFIDEFHLLLVPERKELLDTLKQKLAETRKQGKGTITIIGATNDDKALDALFEDEAWDRRFIQLALEELKGDALALICKKDYPDHRMHEDVIKDIILLKPYLKGNLSDPDASLSIISDVCAWHRINSKGSRAVDQTAFQEYLSATYHEEPSYWSCLLKALKGESYTTTRPKQLKGIEWLSFKVASLFSRVITGVWKVPPQESIVVPYKLPLARPTLKVGQNTKKESIKTGPTEDEVLKKMEELAGPVLPLLKMFGFKLPA